MAQAPGTGGQEESIGGSRAHLSLNKLVKISIIPPARAGPLVEGLAEDLVIFYKVSANGKSKEP
jgi:hypothetical protein